MTASQLSVEKLAIGHDGKPIGRDISFSLTAGETLSLLGPNGSGKTTLFKSILRLIEPLDGATRIDGDDIGAWSRQEMARCFGYVPQAGGGYFPFTVREMVLMGRTARLSAFASPGRRDHDAAEAALERLGITHLAERSYPHLSGGERQLTLIARALAQEPRFLILDEPTASLDFGNQVRVLQQVRQLASSGIGIVLSTHHPDQAFVLSGRAILLRDGRLTASGPVDKVITPDHLRQLYGIEVQVLETEQGRICVPRYA
ncbi:MAG TPA: ABC transporter ATP-binding protein [Kiloniellales bacterium]|nr:ABC transporter ATP-binding protein [Kiloniellales bacterium]